MTAPIDTNSDIDKLIKGKPYYMCRRDGCSVFCDFGRMTVNAIDAEMDKANDKYLVEALTQLLITEHQRTCDLIEAEMPEKVSMIKATGHRESATMDRTWGKTEGYNQAIDEALAIIRRQRGKK